VLNILLLREVVAAELVGLLLMKVAVAVEVVS
jgi:hypothetical protein